MTTPNNRVELRCSRRIIHLSSMLTGMHNIMPVTQIIRYVSAKETGI